MNEKGKVEMNFLPDAEVKKSVDHIIEAAFPRKSSVFSEIRKMLHQMGVRFLLHDLHYMAGIVLLLYLAGGIFVSDDMAESVCSIGDRVMILTPAAFLLPLLFFMINEQEMGMAELQMTSKYTLYHILSLKMLLVSILAAGSNLIWCLFAMKHMGFEAAVQLYFMAVTALGGYSVCNLWLLTKSISLKGQIMLFLIWICANAGLKQWVPGLYYSLVFDLPLLYHFVIWIVLAGLEMKLVRRCFEIGNRGFVVC